MKWFLIFGVCAWTVVLTWCQPYTAAKAIADANFNETTTPIEITIFEEESNSTAVTSEAVTTEGTRSPKSETEENEALFLSLQLQTETPKGQCGRRFARNARIVGGADAYEGEIPWAVSVRLLTTHSCGGAIITQYWVLTAAHCVKRYGARYYRIRLGNHDVATVGFRHELDFHVDEVTVHPSFGQPRRYSNDLALLKLKQPLTFDKFAQPICLPDPYQDLEGRDATAVGWGWMNEEHKGPKGLELESVPMLSDLFHMEVDSENTFESRTEERQIFAMQSKPKKLQKVQVPILNNTICAKWYGEVFNGYVQIHDYQICAGSMEGGKDACQGDSGGPLVMKDGDHFNLIGIVSAGVGCGRRQMPGIYSRVSPFVPWIQEVTGVQM